MAKTKSTADKKAETGQAETTVANSAKLREIASWIREYADRYDQEAKRMDDFEVDFVVFGGMKTLSEKVIGYLRGNVTTVSSAVSAEIDAKRMTLICETPANYRPIEDSLEE